MRRVRAGIGAPHIFVSSLFYVLTRVILNECEESFKKWLCAQSGDAKISRHASPLLKKLFFSRVILNFSKEPLNLAVIFRVAQNEPIKLSSLRIDPRGAGRIGIE